MYSIFNAIQTRHSVRKYKSDPIPEQVLQQIMEAARWAPSGGNGQTHIFGVVKDPDKRQALAQAAGEQLWIADAPVVIACCARLYKSEEESDFSRQVNYLRWGKEAYDWFRSCPNPYHLALLFQNSVPLIPGAHIQLAAAAHGLGTCWIGHLDITKASNILGLPEDVRCYFLMPLGYPAEEKRRPRKPLREITFADEWDQEWLPARTAAPFGELVLRSYQEADEIAWLNIWGQTAVGSDAWVALHHRKPRYQRPALELVAEMNGELVGFMDVEVETEPEQLGYAQDSCCGFVWELGVHLSYRRRGIARAMIERAQRWLTELGIRRMEFWSMDEGAQGFYRHLGMQEMERHWQFHLRLPEGVADAMRKQDRVGLQLAFGTCPIDSLEKLQQPYRIEADGVRQPKVCIGYDYRW
jgi:nitroreductase/N-acetylglutamate synthase-like GNAT family acetyltransferase